MHPINVVRDQSGLALKKSEIPKDVYNTNHNILASFLVDGIQQIVWQVSA